MTTKDIRKIEFLSLKAFKAAKLATKSFFEIETLLSLQDVKRGKVTSYKNSKDLFKKLEIS